MDHANTESIFEVSLDEQSRSFLIETCRWGKLLGILGIIASVVIVLGGIVIMIAGGSLWSLSTFATFGPVLGLIYTAFGVLYMYPSWKLLRFSSDMPAGLRRAEQHLVTSAFGSLKSAFRFWGISTLIVIGLYVVVLIVAVVAKP
jgi:hypothetical protein